MMRLRFSVWVAVLGFLLLVMLAAVLSPAHQSVGRVLAIRDGGLCLGYSEDILL